jgi:hypothetical protein
MKIACFEVKLPTPPPFSGRLVTAFLCVTFCALFLSGCDVQKEFGPLHEEGQGDGRVFVWQGVPVVGEEGNPSIEAKFGISDVSGLTGAAAVDAAFHELSAFIKKGGLSGQPGVINLGDWIDLESLTVNAYGEGDGGFQADNDPVTPDSLPFEGYEGRTLRLIVVGINSFRPNEQYTDVPENAGVDHVVFQFQNTPVGRRMNGTDTNDGGYKASEMREYLVGVDGKSGNFLKGLKTAGVPEDVLWAPVRYVANGYNDNPRGIDAMPDLLWLPTAWEMYGSQTYADAEEKAENQARLDYFADIVHRKKFYGNSLLAQHRLSSPPRGSSTLFCIVYSTGVLGSGLSASSAGGVAPAFCVQ